MQGEVCPFWLQDEIKWSFEARVRLHAKSGSVGFDRDLGDSRQDLRVSPWASTLVPKVLRLLRKVIRKLCSYEARGHSTRPLCGPKPQAFIRFRAYIGLFWCVFSVGS